jgi:hypothetical protein
MVAKRFVSAGEIQAGKAMLVKIVSMLFGLIRAKLGRADFRRSRPAIG